MTASTTDEPAFSTVTLRLDDWGRVRLVPVEIVSQSDRRVRVVLGEACTLPGGTPAWRGQVANVAASLLVPAQAGERTS